MASASSPPPPPVPAPSFASRLAPALAGSALLAYALATLLLVVPVRTPEVQDCGAPGAYLLTGRLDVVPDAGGRVLDADGQVRQLDPTRAADARSRPCQVRVADRAVPAAILLAGATLVGVAAFALELFVARPRRRRARPPADRPPGPDPGVSDPA